LKLSRIEVFYGEDHHFWWRLIARNGRIVACSGEGYTRRGKAERAAESLFPGVRLEWDDSAYL
jgi:uncharacterized protein YegP (UPF0339 family)